MDGLSSKQIGLSLCIIDKMSAFPVINICHDIASPIVHLHTWYFHSYATNVFSTNIQTIL